jgi:hypothetical protein
MEASTKPTDPAPDCTSVCETFTLFPKLPIELRLKIWEEALPGPRIIEIHHDDNRLYNFEGEDEVNRIEVKLPPPILHSVCQES